MKGKAQTVLGLVDGSNLGITLPHEHFFIDIRCYMVEPTDYEYAKWYSTPVDPEEQELAHQKITLENLWFSRYHRSSCEDNLILDDEDTAIREAMYFKKAGGNTIVDVTPNHVGRGPERLVRVAKATNLNIIMGTSYYIARSFTPEMKMDARTEESIAEEFIHDINVGVGDTGIRAGIIGEIGTSWPLEEVEKKVLRAAGIAQRETGAAINIHSGFSEDSPFECIKILKEVGADLNRVVFSHITLVFHVDSRVARARLAQEGCYLEFDLFGDDGIFRSHIQYPSGMATDATRVKEIMELTEDGFLDRVFISHDVNWKIQLRSYGGGGYIHILKFIVPTMRAKGMTHEQINTILVENPRRIHTFV